MIQGAPSARSLNAPAQTRYIYSAWAFTGREVGCQGALLAALILLALPLLLVAAGRIKRLFVPNYAKVYVEQQARLLTVQTTYQQLSPLAPKVSRSMKIRNSPDNLTYAYRRPVDESASSAFSSVSPSKITERNMQLIDLETYVN